MDENVSYVFVVWTGVARPPRVHKAGSNYGNKYSRLGLSRSDAADG